MIMSVEKKNTCYISLENQFRFVTFEKRGLRMMMQKALSVVVMAVIHHVLRPLLPWIDVDVCVLGEDSSKWR